MVHGFCQIPLIRSYSIPLWQNPFAPVMDMTLSQNPLTHPFNTNIRYTFWNISLALLYGSTLCCNPLVQNCERILWYYPVVHTFIPTLLHKRLSWSYSATLFRNSFRRHYRVVWFFFFYNSSSLLHPMGKSNSLVVL